MLLAHYCFKIYFNNPHICYISAESTIHPQVFVAICHSIQHSICHRTRPQCSPDPAKTSQAFNDGNSSASPAQRWSQDGLHHRRTWELTLLSSNRSPLRNVCSKAAIKRFCILPYQWFTELKSSQWSPHISVKEAKRKKCRMVWKGLLNPAHGWEFRESALKPSDADQGHRQTLLVISKVGGRTASPSVHSLEILGPCFYCTGSSRLRAEKLHSSSAAAPCSNTTTQTYREVQYGTGTGRNLGLYTQKKIQQFVRQCFHFQEWRLGFGIFLLLIALYCLGGLFCLENVCLLWFQCTQMRV